jgi:hypothetical protein
MYLENANPHKSVHLTLLSNACSENAPEQREQDVDREIRRAADLEEDADRRDDDRADQTRDVATSHSHGVREGVGGE